MTSRFVEALRHAGRPLIMEVKRRDAHGRELLQDRPIAEVVARYEAAGAPCVSVVTGRWFGGTESMMREVASATDLPLLQKDFFTRREQLRTAGRLGASAVLLTAALLPKSSLHGLIAEALSLGLTPFVEVTKEAEVIGLPHAEQCVVAVNNKDIKTGERDLGDLDRSMRLLPSLLDCGTPCPVSASGIADPKVAARLLDAGFAGLLIGTSLLLTGDLDAWTAEFDAQRAGAASSSLAAAD